MNLEALLPGVSLDDIELQINEGLLTIAAKTTVRGPDDVNKYTRRFVDFFFFF